MRFTSLVVELIRARPRLVVWIVVLIQAALWLILAQGEKGWSPWIVGLLLSVATLTRTNLVYVCIGIGILHVLAAFGLKGLRLYRAGLMGYVVGGLLPVVPSKIGWAAPILDPGAITATCAA